MTDNTGIKNTETTYDPAFVPAFRTGMMRLTKAERRFLDDAITPEIAFL